MFKDLSTSEKIISLWPDMIEAMGETGVMLLLGSLSAIIIGIPLGTLLFLTGLNRPLNKPWLHQLLNAIINITRAIPFLLLVVVMQPTIRAIYGRATGDPIAASFPIMLVSAALYARFVEQSFLDLPSGVVELAESLGATVPQMIFKFLLPEARSSLVIGFTSCLISILSYSATMGVVGGGGIGDFAIRYGYQRYETAIMYVAIVLIIILVEILQYLGRSLARRISRR